MNYLLGIDIGTSGTKTVLFDDEGNTITSATSEYPIASASFWLGRAGSPGLVECSCRNYCPCNQSSGVNPSDIKGVGLSGQMHGMVLLSQAGKVLRSSIIWCDQRTQAECDQITELVGKERLIEITANPALTGFTASKVMWVKNHQPEVFKQIDKVLAA
jgi:xylulokinase